jgi:hypothetical protein
VGAVHDFCRYQFGVFTLLLYVSLALHQRHCNENQNGHLAIHQGSYAQVVTKPVNAGLGIPELFQHDYEETS